MKGEGGREGAVSALLEWAAPIYPRADERETIFEAALSSGAEGGGRLRVHFDAGAEPPFSLLIDFIHGCMHGAGAKLHALVPLPGERGANARTASCS